MNQELIDFCNYVQPIVNGCAGFIKTDGYVTHIPGKIMFMDADEICFGMIDIPVIFNVYMTSIINTFLSLKTPEEQSDLERLTYFTGWNIKKDHMTFYSYIYTNIDSKRRCVFSEPDCYNIPGFEEAVSATSIDSVNVSDGIYNYRIPASKSITQLSKSDSASVMIYDCAYNQDYNNIKTVRYIVTKKKFKISVEIFSNFMVV